MQDLSSNNDNSEVDNPMFSAGMQFFNDQLYSEAMPCFEKAVGQDSKNMDALYYYGVTQVYQEKYDEAMIILDKLIVIDPDDSMNLYQHALCLANLKRYDEGLQSVNKSLVVNTEFGFVYMLKSRILFTKEKYDEALDVCNTVLGFKDNKYLDIGECLTLKKSILEKLGRDKEIEGVVKQIEQIQSEKKSD